jgi:hypothetical protein
MDNKREIRIKYERNEERTADMFFLCGKPCRKIGN